MFQLSSSSGILLPYVCTVNFNLHKEKLSLTWGQEVAERAKTFFSMPLNCYNGQVQFGNCSERESSLRLAKFSNVAYVCGFSQFYTLDVIYSLDKI